MSSRYSRNAQSKREARAHAFAAWEGASCAGMPAQGHRYPLHASLLVRSPKNLTAPSQIITVIEGIAFQTNILALNAAVEAARAGEQGRGFAVVMGEVRTLAQRSASAAKEIKDLIESSVDHVATGGEQVNRAGATMSEIVKSVRQMTDIMGEIASASDEQGTGIEQVNTAVSQMDAVTQQNAALVDRPQPRRRPWPNRQPRCVTRWPASGSGPPTAKARPGSKPAPLDAAGDTGSGKLPSVADSHSMDSCAPGGISVSIGSPTVTCRRLRTVVTRSATPRVK